MFSRFAFALVVFVGGCGAESPADEATQDELAGTERPADDTLELATWNSPQSLETFGVDDTSVFWVLSTWRAEEKKRSAAAATTSLYVRDLSAGKATLLWESKKANNVGRPVSDGERIYFSVSADYEHEDKAKIISVPKKGGPAAMLAEDVQFESKLVLQPGGKQLYLPTRNVFMDKAGGPVRRAPKPVSDSSYVVGFDSRGIYSLDFSGKSAFSELTWDGKTRLIREFAAYEEKAEPGRERIFPDSAAIHGDFLYVKATDDSRLPDDDRTTFAARVARSDGKLTKLAKLPFHPESPLTPFAMTAKHACASQYHVVHCLPLEGRGAPKAINRGSPLLEKTIGDEGPKIEELRAHDGNIFAVEVFKDLDHPENAPSRLWRKKID